MNSELAKGDGELEEVVVRPKRKKLSGSPRSVHRVDLALISGVGFHIGLKRKENKFFTTSLYKVDRLIEEKAG